MSLSSLLEDFNAFHLAWGYKSFLRRGNLIHNIINSLGLDILNDGSLTNIERPNSTDSALDLSICSPDIIWNLSWHTLSEPRGSGHIPIIIKTNLRLISNTNSSASRSL